MRESYYAGGRKVELDRAEDYVAVDEGAAHKAGLDHQVQTASKDIPRLSGGVVLLPRDALDEQTITDLGDAGALQPVYRHNDAVMVALPEVRVEFDTAEQRRAVMDVLAETQATPNSISQDNDDYLTVRPTSGSGVDALKLANEIHEGGRDADASVRFIQYVPKPTPMAASSRRR
jgi:hypothetical protein